MHFKPSQRSLTERFSSQCLALRKYGSSRPEVFCKNVLLERLHGFYMRHATLLKKILLHRCFPVNFVKFLIIPFLCNASFFLTGLSITNIHDLQDSWGRRRVTPPYHFHLLDRHLDISWTITAESSPLHIARSRTRTGNLWFLSASRKQLSYAPLKTYLVAAPVNTTLSNRRDLQIWNLSKCIIRNSAVDIWFVLMWNTS